MRAILFPLLILFVPLLAAAQTAPSVLPGTEPLTLDRPLDEVMVEGIDRFCLREIAAAREQRESKWKRDVSSPEAYQSSLEPYRKRFRTIIGAVDQRVDSIEFQLPFPRMPSPNRAQQDSENTANPVGYTARWNRWPVLHGLNAEGVILRPNDPDWRGMVIAVPDSRWSPEQFAAAGPRDEAPASRLPRILADNGFLVVIPCLINRDDDFSGNPEIAMTNQSHREWVYRSAFEMGRHVIGYEVQKILAAVDLLEGLNREAKTTLPISICGVGDGGQLAMYSAALDTRLQSVMVSGYFQPRENVWQEPIDKNVWRLLTEFGDAEIAGMIAPRPLLIEACSIPETDGPLTVKSGRRGGAAPGQIKSAELAAVRSEFDRAKAIYEKVGAADHIRLIASGKNGEGHNTCRQAADQVVKMLGTTPIPAKDRVRPARLGKPVDRAAVQKRQVDEAIEFTQRLLRRSFKVRDQLFADAHQGSLDKWLASADEVREHVHQELIGKLPEPTMPLNPRTRKIVEQKEFTGYAVVLDTYPDVIAGGILLLPNGMKPDEKRPVVVCQHGLEGVPMDTISGPEVEGYKYYKSFAAELAKRGFITYSPQNPYRGRDLFRTLQRKSNPLGRSLFSYIIPQHQVTLKWLSTLPNVDADRLAFYGLSYGGKTAMRVPPLLPSKSGSPGYCLSICSADFNEWVSKNTTTDYPFSYVFTPEYEIFEWNMGHVANYAELATLMTPRPFMVERGHDDGVGLDEWVAWEYAKVRRHYDKLGLSDKTEIEVFNGPHTINGQGTFAFLHRHLKWPEKSSPQN